ncbi:MAG: LamG-like jellyroll fold domain-containing protein [Pirellulales bacterium]
MRSTHSYAVLTAAALMALSITHVVHADVVTKYAFDGNLLDTAPSGVNADNLLARIVAGAGSETYASGIVGDAVRLDFATGSAFALQAPSSADLNLAANWTLEAFVKPDLQNTGEWDRFWIKWGEGSNDWHWAFRYPNNGLDLFLNGAGPIVSANNGLPANSVPLDKWSHVAIVGDSTANEIRGYINGNQVVTGTYVAAGTGAGTMNFGNFATATPNGLQFTGLIDDAQIHNAAVDVAYLQSRAALIPLPPPPAVAPPPSSGLVSYWTFDGTANDVAQNYTANVGVTNDNLTARDGTANYEAGRVGQALRVGVNAGDTTDLAAPLSADVQLPATYTIEAWVKPSELSDAWQRLVLNWGPVGAEHAYHFAIRNNSGFINGVSLFHAQANLAEPNANGGTVVVNEWQHIAGVADGSFLRVYLNGEEVAAAAYDGTINTTPTEGLGIGDSNTALSTIKYNGLLDDVAIWSVPLTPEQIRYQYQHGLNGFGAPVPEPSTMVLLAVGLIGCAAMRARRQKIAK